ncbi:MAG: DUF1015 domain-containing protein [Clostridia bacterium]|nr:DUF1015 domain-containing protein [Clostridia bacterium]
MAKIKPFRGLRFDCEKAGKIEELVCPPYDIISEEQRQAYLKENEHNIIRLELPKGENPYFEAGLTLDEWLDSGVLKADEKPAVYIYEEQFTVGGTARSFKGCIVRVGLEEFSKGVILPHEETLSKAKEDRFHLMQATNCNFSQIYSLYMDETHSITNRLDRLSEGAPVHELTDSDGVTHRLWIVTDEAEIEAICADFADKKLYIADGHHRYETALNYRNYCRENGIGNGGEDYVMMMLVDMEHPGLLVLPTHRIVRDLKGFDAEEAMKKCAGYFDITDHSGTENIERLLEEKYHAGEKAFAFYTGGNSFKLLVLKDKSVISSLLPDKSASYCGLDVTVLHTLILERIFGIDAENMAKQINLTYVKRFEDAVSSVNSEKAQCAFILNPTRVEEIRDVAAAGEKMPQKSTYFYPKLITGLVMNKLF